MAVPAELTYTNGGETTLSASLATAATEATVADGASLPTGLCILQVWDKATYPDFFDDSAGEFILCASRSGNTLTLSTRAQEGTTDGTHASGSAVRCVLTAGGLARLYDVIQAHAHTGTTEGAQLDHGGALTGLADDDHTQYALLAGRSGGQVVIGGTGAGDDLTLQTTSNASKGSYILSELGTGLVQSSSGTLGILTAAAAITDLNEAYTTGDLDSEAEVISALNATNAAINDLLAALRTAGIVAAS